MSHLLSDSLADFDADLFFQLSHDLYCVAGFDGYFKIVNPAVIATLGYSPEELFSRPINSFIFKDDQDITEAKREELRHSVPLRDFENRYVTKSGAVIWLCWNSVPVPEHQVVFAVARNITHQKQQELDRNRLISRLSATETELKKLIYTIAHDLRTPVSNQLTALHLLDMETASGMTKETSENIFLIRACSNQLHETLNHYLDLLIQKNNFNVPVEMLSFDTILNGVLISLDSLLKDRKAQVFADFSAANQISFNATYLTSIFLNLISNSIKYARPDTPPEITISSRRDEDRVWLTFRDNGSGFDVAKAGDRLFRLNQHFHDGPDSHGIGLYLVRSHLNSLGGSITVESSPGEGTTFTISFKS